MIKLTTPSSDDTLKIIKRLHQIIGDLKRYFAQRDTVIDLIALALICHEPVLFLSPQGTGKSALVTRFATAVQCGLFHYLITPFTDPAELFGLPDIEQFRHGRYHVCTAGMLPEASMVFLDDIFQAGSVVLNTLVSIFQDQVFHNGSERQQVPLITLLAASRHLPDDPTLHAFADYFTLRFLMEPVPDAFLGELLDKGWALEHLPASEITDVFCDPEQLEQIYQALPNVDMTTVSIRYQELLCHLRAAGVIFSDRRMVKGVKLIRAAALLDGRDQADARDFWPLAHIWNTPEEAIIIRDVIQPLVKEAGGRALEVYRPLEDIREDLELLANRTQNLHGDSVFTTHLAALGQLHRELILYYPEAHELLIRVDAEVVRVLETMTQRSTVS